MPQLNADAARQGTDLPFYAWSDATGPGTALARLLTRLDAGRPGPSVALDETMRADCALMLLDALDQPRRRFLQDTVGALRAVKDAHDIDALRASARLNDAAVKAAIAALTPGMTERDAQAVIADHYTSHGARAEFRILAFGPNGALPHHHTGDTVLPEDTAVLIDTGWRLAGYPSDMTRSFWFGTAPADYLAVNAVVEQAVEAALAAARPGVPPHTVDRAARGGSRRPDTGRSSSTAPGTASASTCTRRRASLPPTRHPWKRVTSSPSSRASTFPAGSACDWRRWCTCGRTAPRSSAPSHDLLMNHSFAAFGQLPLHDAPNSSLHAERSGCRADHWQAAWPVHGEWQRRGFGSKLLSTLARSGPVHLVIPFWGLCSEEPV